MDTGISDRDAEAAKRSLLRWYGARQRDLPWRRSRDPYAIWVSEIMLQQTRVETVLRYYERFLARFPTMVSLAQAEIEEVLALWSGLGYYRRARSMHRAALDIVEARSELPATLDGLRALPGVGDYTAAAVGSIAFGLVEPAVDGNVKRVIGRLLALLIPADMALREIRDRARGLLDTERPGDSNQALMEVGATLCTPRRPSCHICPLENICLASLSGDPESYPPRKPSTKRQRVRRLIALARRGERYLLFRRPDDGELLAGIWELPWVDDGESGVEEGLALRYGGRWRLGASHGTIRHAITFRSFEIMIREASLDDGGAVADGREAAWLDAREISALPHSSLVQKVLAKDALAPTQGGA